MNSWTLLSQSTFAWESMWIVVILLAIATIIPVVLSLLHLRVIPVLVIEILMGIILASIPGVRDLFLPQDAVDGIIHTGKTLANLPEGLYMIGMCVLLFLSGLDSDYSVLKTRYKKNKRVFNVVKYSFLLFWAVVMMSALAALIFKSYIISDNKVLGIVLLIVIFSSTFASVVIPLVHDNNLQDTTIGEIISTYSTIAEFVSIASLSTMMIVVGIIKDQNPWLLSICAVILVAVYLIQKYAKVDIFKEKMGGIVHLSMRLIVLTVLVLVILTDMSGAEFILGSFLAGMVMKSAHISHSTMEKVEAIGYGIFVPMFYILAGFKVGLTIPINEIIKMENLLLIIGLFVCLVIVKIPFLIFTRQYRLSTVIPTVFIVSCTLIVSIASEHFGVFAEHFASCLIVASSLTCIIPPIFFAKSKTFGDARPEWKEIIIEPCDLVENHEHQ